MLCKGFEYLAAIMPAKCPTATQKQCVYVCCPVQVSTSCGVALLPECFLPKSSVPNSLLQLLQDLKLPILRLPDPDSSGWAFLQELGVSMELQGCTLLKILQQLSSSGASPKLDSMQQLYSRIHALCQLDERVTAAMCAAFGEQRLVFVPGTGKSKGSWRRSSEVCWKPAVGVQRLFPHTMFIEGYYGYRRHDPQHQVGRLGLKWVGA